MADMLNAARLAVLVALAALPGCAARDQDRQLAGPPAIRPAATFAWRELATDVDRQRLRDLRSAYDRAVAGARDAGQSAAIKKLGPLVDPDMVLADPAPPPGAYRCRTIKLGTRAPGGLAYVEYPPFACTITPDKHGLRLEKTGGSQRPVGVLHRDDGMRMIFLGTMVLGDEKAPIPYGVDPERNMVGALERVAPRRWRLALPFPAWESLLDLIEIEPAA